VEDGETECESDEVRRWLRGFRRTSGGETTTPYQVINLLGDEDDEPLYPLAAALILAGGVICEEGPDEALPE
jgi:hypothetical protein